MVESSSSLLSTGGRVNQHIQRSKTRWHVAVFAAGLSLAVVTMVALPSDKHLQFYQNLVVGAAHAEALVDYPAAGGPSLHHGHSNKNEAISDRSQQLTPAKDFMGVNHHMLVDDRVQLRPHKRQARSSSPNDRSSSTLEGKGAGEKHRFLLSGKQHKREAKSRVLLALSDDRPGDADLETSDTDTIRPRFPPATLAPDDVDEGSQDIPPQEDASSAAAFDHRLNCDQDGGKDFHERLTAQAIMAAGLESIYEAASIELRHTMILTSYHKMGTVMMKDLAWAITKILAPWKQCYLQHCQFEDLQSPPGCELVSFIQDGSEKMTSSFCEQALQYARSTPWTQWNPHMGIIILGMNGAFIPVNATPPAVRVVEFVRDPWDVSASNYAYTLKGTEDWMFVGKPEFDGMSFYDAVHTEKGPLNAAWFSIWEEMNMLQDMGETVPSNALYVRFEDMIVSLQATINRILSHIGIPEMLHSPVSHHMCLNQKNVFETSASCLYNDNTHVSDPSVKGEAKRAMAEDQKTKEWLDQVRAELDARVPCLTENCGRDLPQSHETCAAEFMRNMGNEGFDLDNFDTVHE